MSKIASTKIQPKETMSKESKSEGAVFSICEIQSLLEMLEKHGVNDFELERGDSRISLSRGYRDSEAAPQVTNPYASFGFMPQMPYPQMGYPQQAPQQNGMQVPQQGAAAEVVATPKVNPNLKEVTSPMVGTFYRRPKADSDPYVQVGDVIKKGDVLCIVEAMKLMNEIETDIGGKIVEICLEDGQMVEYGEVLFRVEPV